MLSFKPLFTAGLVLIGGHALAQTQPGGLIIDAPRFAPYVGTTIPLSAHAQPARTVSSALAHITWESSDPTIAWVTGEGAAVLLRPGKVTLTARLGRLAGARTLDIRESGARSIALTLDRDVLHPGESAQVTALARDAHGNNVPNARANVGVVADDASVDANGNFVAHKPGTYLIVAELGGVSVTRQIDVAPTGLTQQGTPMTDRIAIAEPREAPYAGSTLAMHLVGDHARDGLSDTRWSVSDTTIARIGVDGSLSLKRPGEVTVIATRSNQRADRKLDVQPNPVADMALRVDHDVRVGHKVHVTVDTWARGGRRVTDARIDYAIAAVPQASSDAMISDDGVFVARAPGVYTIIAAVAGKADSQTLLVRN